MPYTATRLPILPHKLKLSFPGINCILASSQTHLVYCNEYNDPDTRITEFRSLGCDDAYRTFLSSVSAAAFDVLVHIRSVDVGPPLTASLGVMHKFLRITKLASFIASRCLFRSFKTALNFTCKNVDFQRLLLFERPFHFTSNFVFS